MNKSIYGDKAGNAAHTGFLPGSGIQRHSAGGDFPLIISTRENYDTGIGYKYVWDGRDGKEYSSFPYRIGHDGQTRRAGLSAEASIRAVHAELFGPPE